MFIPGVVALWVAAAALVASTVFYARCVRGHDEARVWARQLYGLMVFAVAVAAAVLMYLILSHDFRLHYVFSYSDRELPLSYLISTFWAGQEGSFLLWLLWGALIGLPLARFARHYEDRALLIYNLTLGGLLLLLLISSPFRFLEGLPPGQMPFDGQGLNPLLQNPWMTIHPPVMFIGYAATAVPFALAVAALWERRYDEWIRVALPWALVSVVALGAGIFLGGYWAYVTLGWGGYWGWDPVENASLVPWLTSVALVHGMLLQKARGRFRKLNFALASLSYVLVVYATFLTRSGVLADFSVHSFVDLGITGWLVGILAAALLIGLGALLWRWREIPSQPGDEPFLSRTAFSIMAIATLLGAALVVSVGTSSPLITRLWGEPAQVKPDFYNEVTLPVGIALALLLAVVPYLHWRGAAPGARNRLAWALLGALATTAVAAALGASGALFLAFLFASVLAVLANTVKTWEKIREAGIAKAGGHLAHVGLALMLAGIITSSAWDRTEKVTLPLGETRQALGYSLTFKGVEQQKPGARPAMLVEVGREGGSTFLSRPRMFRNAKSNQLVANPDVHVHLTHDVYVAPVEYDPGRPSEHGTTVELAKGESATVGPLRLTFRGFDRGGDHGESGHIVVGAVLAVATGAGEGEIRPILRSTATGFEGPPVAVDGVPGVTVALTGVNAAAGRVRLQVNGAGGGVATRASLRAGETLTYRGIPLTFVDLDLAGHHREGGPLDIRAVFQVAREGGEPIRIAPAIYDLGGQQRSEDVFVPGLDGVLLRLARVDAETRTVQVAVLDPAVPADPGRAPQFSADISIKPLIALVWTGLVVLLLGSLLAAVRRGREFGGAPEPAP
jgi:cytochrome c-type biogenesis protein CcmF